MTDTRPPSTSPLPAPVAAPSWIDAIGRFVFRYRDYLAPGGLVLLLALTAPTRFLGNPRAEAALDWLGIAIASLGQMIRVMVIGLAYIQRGGKKKQLSAPVLVARGIYAHSRNPMYLGNFLLLGGLALIYNSPLVYVVILPVYYLGILSIVKSEESFLHGKFGEQYEDYCRRVPRFVPTLSGLGRTLSSMTFDWRRVLRKEYGTTFAWTSTVLFLLGWQQVVWESFEAARPALARLGAVWLCLLALYLTVRWLKKSRRLWSPDEFQPGGGA